MPTSTHGPKRTSSSNNGDPYEWILWLFLATLGILALRSGYEKWSATHGDPRERLASWWDQIVPWLLPGGVLLATVVVLLWWLRSLRRRRAYLVKRYATTIAPAMPVGFETDHLEVTRWRGLRPRKIKITLLPDCRDDDPVWRTQVEELLAKRTGEQLTARWPGAGRLWRAHRRLVLATVKSRQDPISGGRETQSDEVASDGLHSAVGLLMPNPKVRVTARTDAGDPSALQISYAETTRDMSPNWRARVVGQVENRLGGTWRTPNWDTKNRTVHLELVPSLPPAVPWTPPEQQNYKHLYVPYGVDEDGYTVAWELGPRQPHAAVVGETGSGKTQAMISMTGSALQLGVMTVIIAPKAEDFMVFLEMPGVACVATSIEDRAEAVCAVYAQMERRLAASGVDRLEQMRPNLAGHRPPSAALDSVHLLVMIDELTQLIDEFDKWWKGLPKAERVERWGSESTRCPMSSMLPQIARKSRSAGINLLLGMQRPDAKNFGDSTEMRDQLGHRVSMGALSAIGSGQHWGDRATGQIVVENVGEGVTNATRLDDSGRPAGTGTPRRFKGFHLDEQTLASEEYSAIVAQTAPNVSLLDLGNVSPAARRIDAALEALRQRAGYDATQDDSSATIAERRDELVEVTEAAPATPVRDVSNEPEVDDRGRAWEQHPVTDLGDGDVVATDDIEAATVVEAGWFEDEFTSEPVFRLVVETDDGEAEWDMDPDDSIHRQVRVEQPV